MAISSGAEAGGTAHTVRDERGGAAAVRSDWKGRRRGGGKRRGDVEEEVVCGPAYAAFLLMGVLVAAESLRFKELFVAEEAGEESHVLLVRVCSR